MSTKEEKKSILINNKLHQDFKDLCTSKNYKMGGVVEKIIKEFIDKENNKKGDESKS
jgi:hypothetical protein